MFNRCVVFAAFGLALWQRPAFASILGEENGPLMAIFSESVKQTVAIKETLVSLKETAEAARDTARFAQHAVAVTPRIRSILKDPQRFFADAEKAWGDAFPEIEVLHQRSSRSARFVKKSTGLDLHYDQATGKLIKISSNLAQDAGNLFERWTQEVDNWGVSDAHAEIQSLLGEHHRMALSNLADLATSVDLHLLTPMEATIHSARATAIEAVAAVQSAAALNELSRNEKIKMMREVQEATSRNLEHAQNIARSVASTARSWEMRPIFSAHKKSSATLQKEEATP